MNMQLRRPERNDLDVVVDWLADPAFRRFLYGDNERIKQQMGSQIFAILGGALAMPLAAAGHFICDLAGEGPVGLASIVDLSWRNRFCLVSTYMAESVEPVAFYNGVWYRSLEYCFDEVNLHRVSARLDASNEAALRAFERAGGKRELVLRGHAQRDGTPCDVYGYGVLRAEFDRARPSLETILTPAGD
jgi:RimJ/RimL family protein N-acetyltransferase